MAALPNQKLFVTVGTTNFDSLIEKVHQEDIIGILREQYGIGSLIIQLGHGVSPMAELPDRSEEDAKYSVHGMPITAFRLKPGISEYINAADIVISHAGAGSIFETLRAHKKLIVVVNEDLMDNHQTELADAMADGCHARATTCDKLLTDLRAWAAEAEPIPSVPLPEPDTDALLDAINSVAGCKLFEKKT